MKELNTWSLMGRDADFMCSNTWLHTINPSIKRSTGQSTHPSIGQSTHPWTGQSVHPPIGQPIHSWSNYQPIHPSIAIVATQFFLHDTPAFDVPTYQVWLQKVECFRRYLLDKAQAHGAEGQTDRWTHWIQWQCFIFDKFPIWERERKRDETRERGRERERDQWLQSKIQDWVTTDCVCT